MPEDLPTPRKSTKQIEDGIKVHQDIKKKIIKRIA